MIQVRLALHVRIHKKTCTCTFKHHLANVAKMYIIILNCVKLYCESSFNTTDFDTRAGSGLSPV